MCLITIYPGYSRRAILDSPVEIRKVSPGCVIRKGGKDG